MLAAGDPRREQVVGVVGEVVPDQSVEQVAPVLQLGLGQDNQVSVSNGDCTCPGPVEVGVVLRDQCRGDQDGRVIDHRGQREHLVGGVRIATDQAEEEGIGFGALVGHVVTFPQGADAALMSR